MYLLRMGIEKTFIFYATDQQILMLSFHLPIKKGLPSEYKHSKCKLVLNL